MAEHLGDTPSVTRSSYIDPRVVAQFEQGETIDEAAVPRHMLDAPGHEGGRRRAPRALEEAVIELLDRDTPEA